jgi:hypothetical protein
MLYGVIEGVGNKEEASPLLLSAQLRATVDKIPFYELHASQLRDAGHEQVAVYRPPQAAV